MTDQGKPPKALTPTEQAWAEYGKWCDQHRERCPDCEHEAIEMTFLYAEYCEGERAAYAKAIEDAAEIAYGIADELQSKAGNASDEDDVEGYDTATTWVDRVAAAIGALIRADAEAQK